MQTLYNKDFVLSNFQRIHHFQKASMVEFKHLNRTLSLQKSIITMIITIMISLPMIVTVNEQEAVLPDPSDVV